MQCKKQRQQIIQKKRGWNKANWRTFRVWTHPLLKGVVNFVSFMYLARFFFFCIFLSCWVHRGKKSRAKMSVYYVVENDLRPLCTSNPSPFERWTPFSVFFSPQSTQMSALFHVKRTCNCSFITSRDELEAMCTDWLKQAPVDLLCHEEDFIYGLSRTRWESQK